MGCVSTRDGDGSSFAEAPGLDASICQLESTDCLERYPLGFLRGLHFWVPAGIMESCTRGEAFDVFDAPR